MKALDRSPIIETTLRQVFRGDGKIRALFDVSAETRAQMGLVVSLLEIPLTADVQDLLNLLFNTALYREEPRSADPISSAVVRGVRENLGKHDLISVISAHKILDETSLTESATMLAVNGGISLLEASQVHFGKPHSDGLKARLAEAAQRNFAVAGRVFPSEQLIATSRQTTDCIDVLEATKALALARSVDAVLEVYHRRLNRAA